MLLVLASMIAFMGLIENNTVVLVASMLVSPIMGPILVGIFGSVIGNDRWDISNSGESLRANILSCLIFRMRNQGVKNEMISLAICILIGFLGGLCFDPWIEQYGVQQWPTQGGTVTSFSMNGHHRYRNWLKNGP